MIAVNSISKSFDKGSNYVLNDISFRLQSGDICAIVGESGSGKTTLIRLLAGLEKPDSGEIWINEQLVSSMHTLIPAEKRKVGLVFQEYALFPHLTVLENITYGISKQKDKKERAFDMLELVGLSGYEKRFPHQLSGGQQQRVALARAIAPNPTLLILDEPFSNLDSMLRIKLRDQIFEIISRAGLTAIFVTHDTQDALAVADEILILKNGKIVQKDHALNLYNKPASIYVASLFGNTIELNRELQTAFSCPLKPNCQHAIRSEALNINTDCEYVTTAKVIKKSFLGTNSYLLLRLANGAQFSVVSKETDIADEIKIGFNSADIMEFLENKG